MIYHINCPVVYNITDISPAVNASDPTDLSPYTIISMDSQTREVTVDSDNNFFGNKEYVVTVSGFNMDNVESSMIFSVITTKDC